MMAKRRGISLVELLVTMTACAAILTLSAGLIHRMFHVQSRSRMVENVQRTSFRLERSFRQDIHQATEIEESKDPGVALLKLQLPGEQVVEYRKAEGGIERVQLAEQKVTSRETFAFPDQAQFRLERAGRLWTLSAVPGPDALPTAHTVRVLLHLEAAQRQEDQ